MFWTGTRSSHARSGWGTNARDHTTGRRDRPQELSGRQRRFGLLPDAIVAVSQVSFAGNQQHNPGLPLRWTRGKSADEADTMIRHFLQRGLLDTDGIRHSAKMAWRALALLQKEIEAEQEKK